MLEAEALRLSNQARFILEKCDNTLVVENKKKKMMIAELQRKNFDPDPVKKWKAAQAKAEANPDLVADLDDDSDSDLEEDAKDADYDYTKGKRRKELGLPEIYLYKKDTKAVCYADFVNKELVLFSNLDNERSIPCVVDGFKPGQRKVMFTCLKRNDKREVKVAQLAGSVGEMSAYHHGEASLMGTIIGLAQDFVGSNNINLLQPIGQFGTRLAGGKDHASPRYIFTQMSPLTRLLFNANDDPLLKYLNEDNQRIEPEW